MTAIGIFGRGGRMGRAIVEAAPAMGVRVVGVDEAEVLVDFSVPEALAAHLDAAVAAGMPIVIGTTGLEGEHQAAIDAAAARIPLVQAANTSLGITVLAGLIERAAALLGTDWDVEIVEMHHRHKLDAPSGTALLLGAAAARGRGGAAERSDRMAAGRQAREAGTIHYSSLRGGTVAGDHQVIFAGEGERIEIGHRAESRDIFARGAVRAALWLAAGGRAPGRYGMADVLA